MVKKAVDKKLVKKAKSDEKSTKKLVAERAQELVAWKSRNAVQKWFFSMDEREQALIEKTFIIVVQICPQLTWEDYLDRLRMSDKQDNITKTIVKKIIR